MTPSPAGLKSSPEAGARSHVRNMFTAIAPRYDLLNHVLSLNIDRRWRRRAISRLGYERFPSGTFLDLCAGTLDLAIELERRSGFHGRVVGADFVVPMLRLGRGKARRVQPVGADALDLPFADGTFDGVTVGFGIRNLPDVDEGLAEIVRVLKPGGRLVILEFATPTAWPIRSLYLFYFQRILPLIGRLVSKHRSAYSYLPNSVLEFPGPERFKAQVRGAGFGDVEHEALTLGIAGIYVGEKGRRGQRGQRGQSDG
jgi:demethylmenaquinone methyltransferase/2-methoxy-6-polyprenyl-1,4-benzoquinol methylase